jgi:N-dimethylarginine dimethylaminohydrolase
MKAFGAQSMTAPLRAVLVKRPGDAFGRAFEDPVHGYRHPVDLARAQREHDAFVELLTRLGVIVHELGAENESPDLVYTFDPMLMTDRGAIALRSGKATRIGEEAVLERWTRQRGIPLVGRITSPGTVDGGDTFWLRPDLFCIGRSLRTNAVGAARLAELVGGDTHVFDVPYGQGPAECLHLLSLLSPVAEDAAVCFLPLLPAGLFELLREVGMRIVPVPEEEFPSQAPNILAVRPGVLVMMSGNPRTERALGLMGCEVHTYEAEEIGMNGSGGPTCLARPILRG